MALQAQHATARHSRPELLNGYLRQQADELRVDSEDEEDGDGCQPHGPPPWLPSRPLHQAEAAKGAAPAAALAASLASLLAFISAAFRDRERPSPLPSEASPSDRPPLGTRSAAHPALGRSPPAMPSKR